MIQSDFHIHTDFSGDCNVSAEFQINKAISLGMKEICITDHHDYDVESGDIDFTLDFPKYLERLKELQEYYRQNIRVNIGVELGLQLHIKDYLEKLVKSYDFDFVIGSNHFIHGIDVFYPCYFDGKTEENAYGEFFEISLSRVKALDCFDVLGHLDFVIRYGPNTNKDYSYEKYHENIDYILKYIIEHGKGIECNTGGYKYGLNNPNPGFDIIKRYRELGGEIITMGSDAHDPGFIGYEFSKADELLKQAGFKYYTVYHNRRPEFISL